MPGINPDVSAVNDIGQSRAADQEAGKASGTFKDAKVQVIDINSLIADAAEELTSELSEEEEKDISERAVEDGRKSDSLERVLKLSEISKLLQALGDLDRKGIQRAINLLLRQQSENAADLRERARDQFKEPAHQYVLLKSLAEALKARGAPQEQIAAAQTAADQLMKDEGESIRAAINIGSAAEEFVDSELGDVQTLRDAYRSNVLDYKSASATLDNLTERFGDKDLETSIRFMTKALAADLESDGTSIDKAKLNVILNDMHRLKTMTTVLSNCGILVRKAQQRGASKDFTPTKVLREIVHMQDATRIVPDRIGAIPEQAGLFDLDKQINFLNDFKEVARLVPEKSFSHPENREKMLEAIQDALNDKIQLEEEQEDAE